MSMTDLYQEIILDHSRSPRHAGLREPFDGQSHQVNPTCGDEVTLRVTLRRGQVDGPTIADVSYSGMGCSISQASISVMSELVIGKPVAEARRLDDAFEAMVKSKGEDPGDDEVLDDAVAFAGVSKYPNRVKCALLGWKAFTAALSVAEAAGIGDNESHE